MKQNNISTELLEIIKNNNCVPFLGAGFAIAAGLPSTSQILNKLCARINYHYTGNEQFEKVTEIYENIKGSVELRKFFASELSQDKIKLSKGHKILGELVNANYFKRIITTNYDNIIEKCIESSTNVRRLVTDSPIAFINFDDIEIIKYHGSIDRESTMVITESDYFKAINTRQQLYSHLMEIFSYHHLLIIGFSMSDIDFRYFFHNLRYQSNKFTRRAFLLHHKNINPNWELEKTYYWNNKNIEVIECSLDDFFVELKNKLMP